jgi:hypothetical protein
MEACLFLTVVELKCETNCCSTEDDINCSSCFRCFNAVAFRRDINSADMSSGCVLIGGNGHESLVSVLVVSLLIDLLLQKLKNPKLALESSVSDPSGKIGGLLNEEL